MIMMRRSIMMINYLMRSNSLHYLIHDYDVRAAAVPRSSSTDLNKRRGNKSINIII